MKKFLWLLFLVVVHINSCNAALSPNGSPSLGPSLDSSLGLEVPLTVKLNNHLAVDNFPYICDFYGLKVPVFCYSSDLQLEQQVRDYFFCEFSDGARPLLDYLIQLFFEKNIDQSVVVFNSLVWSYADMFYKMLIQQKRDSFDIVKVQLQQRALLLRSYVGIFKTNCAALDYQIYSREFLSAAEAFSGQLDHKMYMVGAHEYLLRHGTLEDRHKAFLYIYGTFYATAEESACGHGSRQQKLRALLYLFKDKELQYYCGFCRKDWMKRELKSFQALFSMLSEDERWNIAALLLEN